MAINKEQVVGFVRKNPVGISCLAIFLVLTGYYIFRSGALPEAEDQLTATTELADRLALNLKNSAQLPEQLQEMRAASAKVDARIIQASTLATNLQYFYKLVAETGTKLLELRQLPLSPTVKKEGSFTPITYAVSVQGDYPHVIALLRSLENGTHFCRINTASLTPAAITTSAADEAEELVTLTLNLELLGVQ